MTHPDSTPPPSRTALHRLAVAVAVAVAAAAALVPLADAFHVHAAVAATSSRSNRLATASRASVDKQPARAVHGAAVAQPSQHTLAPTVVTPPWAEVGPRPIVGNENLGSNPPGQFGNNSGRVTAMVVDPTNPSVVYTGTAGGGVWKSTDAGTTWTAMTDGQLSLAVGSLAIDPTGQVIYAGTGEENENGDAQYGQGVLKSSNGGSTWTLLDQGTFAGGHIGGLAVDRTTSGGSQHVFAATDFGLFVSTNGGGTWTENANFRSHITHAGTATGGTFEIYQDPAVSTRFFASVGDACQTEYGQVLVSNDGGTTWSNSDPADLANRSARIGLGVGPNNTEYAAWSDCNGDLLKIDRSTNGGVTWTNISHSGTSNYINYFDLGNPQGWYDNVVAVDPGDANRAVFGGVSVINTTNGGGSFSDVGHVYDPLADIHPDFHAAAFTGANTLFIGNDGGVYHTTTLGGTSSSPAWTNRNGNLGTIQFYSGDALSVSTLIGGAQDNGDPGRLPGAPPAPEWQQYGVGDGTGAAIVPGSSGSHFYFSTPGAGIFKQVNTLSGGFESDATYVGPCNVNSDPACNDPVAFIAPFSMDPTNGQRLLAGTDKVYETTTGGGSAGGTADWSAISPDLTTGTSNSFGAQDTLSVITIDPAATNTVFTGSAFGKVAMTTNDGGLWTDITGTLPQPNNGNFAFTGNPWIGGIAVNPANSSELWVTIGNSVGIGSVWHTIDSGAHWNDLSSSGTVPVTGPVNAVVRDPSTATTIYVGTNYGAYKCTSCGGASPTPSWSTVSTMLPTVAVDGLTVSSDSNTLVAWTHGRGAWAFPLSGSGTTVANVQPTSINFGPNTAGARTPTQTVTLSNWGDASMSVTSASLAGSNPGEFSIVGDTCSGNALAPNSSCTVQLAFAPTLAGVDGASLQLTDSDSTSPQSITLSGTGTTAPLHLSSALQYSLNGSDGSTWVPIDTTNLSTTIVPTVNSIAEIIGNADLWTSVAGFNQDIGILVTPQGGASTAIAWKESGGFAGTFSPNAAAVQGQVALTAGTPTTVRLVWKTNKPMPSGDMIFDAAGGTGNFSPSTLDVILHLSGSNDLQTATTAQQYQLTASSGDNGTAWRDVDATNLTLTVTPASTSKVMLTGNADLWTANAGINQDVGIAVTPQGGAASLVAWKESGGFAGTYSPNAAFVQALYTMTGGVTYTVRLQWRANHAMSAGQAIFIAAGGTGNFSPTSLFASTYPAAAPLTAAVSTQQYTLTANGGDNGTAWRDVDATNLSQQVTPGANNCVARITGNADLWTANAGINQDIGIVMTPQGGAPVLEAWKESGGFAGTYSPNAAFVQASVPLNNGVQYTIRLQWKANHAMSSGQQIRIAAGAPSNFSPTSLDVDLRC